MKKPDPQKLRVAYELIPTDPAEEKNVRQELERGFDILFDIVFSEVSKQNKIFSTQKPILDSSVRLGIR